MQPLLLLPLLLAPGNLPVYGRPVPEFQFIDDTMQSVMDGYGISEGVAAVMRDGVVLYQRGFGCPENTPMRIASIEKPITAAAVRVLVAQNLIALDDNAFALDQFGGGILDIDPWQGLGTEWLKYVTVQDLLDHRGGWDSDLSPDPQFNTLEYGTAMGLSGPANREQLVSYMLSQNVDWVPGTTYAYSNFGYMCLGLIIEQVSGQNLQDFVRANVLTPNLWVPSTEIFRGQTFASSQSPREPYYDDGNLCTNIFNPGGAQVLCPYGNWSLHEAFQGHGNYVASAAPLLEFANRYNLFGTTNGGSMIGAAHGGNFPNWAHTGAIPGTSTVLRQRSDGVCIAILFNKRVSGIDVALWASDLLAFWIDGGGVTWPTEDVDGTYLNFTAQSSGYGGYNDPIASVGSLLSTATDGTKVRVMKGGSSWTGVIDRKLVLDAPIGTATIGD